ncbi:MAG: hypothetical protein F4W89_13015 [Acidobacteria bacterium]|nr:hypothetical protein [Acidobacteriota bacterium]
MEDAVFVIVLQTVAAWITFLGLVGLTGAVTCLPLISRACEIGEEVERVISGLATASALALVLGAGMRLYAQTWSVFGLDEALTIELVRVVAFESRWGGFWRPQAGIAVLAFVAVVGWRRWPRLGWGSAAVAVVAGWLTLPMTGHAMSFDSSLPGAVLAVHGLAGGLWIGTLTAIVVATPKLILILGGHGYVARLVRSFSPLAIVAVTAVALSGLVAAVVNLETVDQLWTTRYGQVLLAKVGLFVLTGAIGLRNWRWVTPRLGNPFGTYALLRSAGAELAVGALVLLAAALLIHLAMPYVPM